MFTLFLIMKRTFVVNLFLLVFLNLLVKPFWIFGIDRVVQIEVSEETYGMYYALINFSFLFNIVLDAGITNFNNKNVAQHKQMLQKHFSWMFSTKLILGAAYAIVTMSAAIMLGYSSMVLPMLGWLILNQFLASFILYLRSNISGLLLFKQDSLLSILDRVIMILLVGYLLYVRVSDQPFDIMWFVYAQTIAYALTSVIGFLVVKGHVKVIKLSWKPVVSIAVLKQSLPFAMLILLMTLYNRTDAIMLERLHPDGAFQTGVYAKGYRLLDALNNIAYLFAALLLPIFSRLAIEKKSVNEVVKSAQNLLLPASVFIAFFCWQFQVEITQMLYPNTTELNYAVFSWLMIGFVAVSFNYIHGTLLTANNYLKALNIMAICALLLNVVLNFTFIPSHGALGAAIATIVTQFFTVIIQGYLVHKKGMYQFKWKFFAKTGAFLVSLVIIHHVVKQMEWTLIQQMVCIGFAGILLAWVFKFVQIRQVKNLIRQKDAD
ncbi:MAG: O-antigen/teichoic acid export membrane protein [Flavobacteriales bacterium]